MLKTMAIIFGFVFLLVGILGFVPAATTHGHLLGIFHVNPVHNMIHIASGIVALFCGFQSVYASRQYFRIFGLIYGAVAILGFFHGDNPIFGIVANNMADTWLHVGISIVSLVLGFGVRETAVEQVE